MPGGVARTLAMLIPVRLLCFIYMQMNGESGVYWPWKAGYIYVVMIAALHIGCVMNGYGYEGMLGGEIKKVWSCDESTR